MNEYYLRYLETSKRNIMFEPISLKEEKRIKDNLDEFLKNPLAEEPVFE